MADVSAHMSENKAAPRSDQLPGTRRRESLIMMEFVLEIGVEF